jgi:hypothetical protein
LKACAVRVTFCFGGGFRALGVNVARIDDHFESALKNLPPKPPDTATQSEKRRYSEKLSAAVALVLGEELRFRGLREARPAGPGELDISGAERRMAGGVGAKKVDVTWSTEQSGLLFAISVKSINFRDQRTHNFQKNLTNRRGEMLMEAVTLHRRFPYAVLAAFFFLDKGAESDNVHEGQSRRRRSTFHNAHARLRLFTGRTDPAGRDEQYERFYLLLVEATPTASELRAYEVGKPETPVPLDEIISELLNLVAERNPDFYEYENGRLIRLPS